MDASCTHPAAYKPWNLCSLPALFPSISSGIRVPLRFWACKLDETGSLLSSLLILRVSLMSRNKYYVWSCLNCSVRSWSVQVFSRQRNRRLIENSSRFLTKFIIFKDTIRFGMGLKSELRARLDNWLILHREQWFSMTFLFKLISKFYNFNMIEGTLYSFFLVFSSL